MHTPPLPFTVQASVGCPTHAQLALSLATEFTDVDVDAVDATLDLLATSLSDADAITPYEQLDALADLMRAFTVREPRLGVADLLVDQVLATCAGHPTTLAAIAVEAAARAGMPMGVIGNGLQHLVAHRELDDRIALDLMSVHRPPSVVEVADRRLAWRCSHQLCFAMLGELVDRSGRAGDLVTAMRAAELRISLPMTEEAKLRQRQALAGIRARLN